MCTGVRFADAAGNLYFGRNLDWCESYGEGVVITPRGASIPTQFLGSLSPEHACVGMGIVVGGVPCYFDCANEAGLAIAGLNFPGYAQFAEAPEEGAVNVAAYEFPLWVAASFSTVAEVRKALKDVVIVAKAPSEGYGVAQLHWLVGDGKESIVIECQADGMHVYDDGLDVLTNQPPFPWHTENVRNYMHIETAHPEAVTWTRDTLRAFGSGAGMIGFPGGYDPASRFVRAAFLNAHYPAEEGEAANVTRLFRTLEGASMCKGGAQMADGRFEYTMFSGFNDDKRHADALIRMLRGLECRVNLIRFHKIPDFPYESSSIRKMEEFRDRLNNNGILCTIRSSRGEDILAACGMLAGKHAQKA